tara:strand:+ start:1425 stop:1613 length:189 start_codon:yes stop_codon:yes gene_type:complete
MPAIIVIKVIELEAIKIFSKKIINFSNISFILTIVIVGNLVTKFLYAEGSSEDWYVAVDKYV